MWYDKYGNPVTVDQCITTDQCIIHPTKEQYEAAGYIWKDDEEEPEGDTSKS